ncbi:response regulator transcription factor [Longimicrobium sp.]|uniref:response regulator transcription factor n=1 Tax=Longimicrobium sp. TaxID=2029185 RepID=UPI002E2F8A17|nr:response regulator transcription factor [Longimicrobium sp.]HEX6037437.1 response regulator transcription factor [Longimicrobium sp.]
MTEQSPEGQRIRVLLADDHSVVRLGLRALLGAAPDIEVVGEATNGAEAVERVQALNPDVVVMDVSMAGMDGVAATRELTRLQVPTRVLVLTMHDEEAYLVPLLEAGAMGYVVKSAASATLLGAVRTVAQGRRFVRPEAAPVLAEEFVRRTAVDETRQRYESLSERERSVFLLFAQGYSTSQIGERLFISAKTADTYRRRINEKLGMSERADYVRLALGLGLLAAPESPS